MVDFVFETVVSGAGLRPSTAARVVHHVLGRNVSFPEGFGEIVELKEAAEVEMYRHMCDSDEQGEFRAGVLRRQEPPVEQLC